MRPLVAALLVFDPFSVGFGIRQCWAKQKQQKNSSRLIMISKKFETGQIVSIGGI
jgi:hypothetical protein